MTHNTNTPDYSTLSIDELLHLDERACRAARRQRFRALVDGLRAVIEKSGGGSRAAGVIKHMLKRLAKVESGRVVGDDDDELSFIDGDFWTTARCEPIAAKAAALIDASGLSTGDVRRAFREAARTANGDLSPEYQQWLDVMCARLRANPPHTRG